MAKRKSKAADGKPDVEYLRRVLKETLDSLGELPVIDDESREIAGRAHREADRLLEYASAGQWIEAILTAFCMGAESKCLANWPPVAKEIKRKTRLNEDQDRRKRQSAEQAEIARDRVALLVHKKGMDVGAAQEQVAKEMGKSGRQVRRYCQQTGHG
jgi:hypothetical protein